MKSVKGWVVVDKEGDARMGTFNEDKKWSKGEMENYYHRDWKELYKIGYRCIRATLRADE